MTKIARDLQKLLQDKGRELTFDDLLSIGSLGQPSRLKSWLGLSCGVGDLSPRNSPLLTRQTRQPTSCRIFVIKNKRYFVCLTLDGANRLISKRIITIGMTSSLVHPREVFAEAIGDRAASIIVAPQSSSNNLQSKGDAEQTGDQT